MRLSITKRRWPVIRESRARFTAAVSPAWVKMIPKVAAPISRRRKRSTPQSPRNFVATGLANDRGRKCACSQEPGRLDRLLLFRAEPYTPVGDRGGLPRDYAAFWLHRHGRRLIPR